MGNDEAKGTLQYFEKGENINGKYAPQWVFNVNNAKPALNAKYWQKAISVTDILDFMPDKRRNEWNDSISSLKTPDFDSDTVHQTLKELMNQRMDFLAEMVDGIFTGLSGEHVTNRPEAFCKRMILGDVCCDYSSYGHRQAGLIHDMRCVIAKFMGRDEKPPFHSTRTVINTCKTDTGTWFNIDGNAFRMRVYKKGTAHIEINQDIAYRLNQILAYLHPMAIAAPHKKRPNRKPPKDFAMIERPLPFEVLDSLSQLEVCGGVVKRKRTVIEDKHIKNEVNEILEVIGGVRSKDEYDFKYDPREVINHIVTSGVIPDKKTHQFYPTSKKLAEKIVAIADIDEHHLVLEPSAGQGSILECLPCFYENITAIEASSLHCGIIRKKELTSDVICGDFLEFKNGMFDRIVMNPPFSQGRAKLHVEHAISLLKKGGKLVAILPSSFHGKVFNCERDVKSTVWHGTYENEFAGTSVKVTIVEITK